MVNVKWQGDAARKEIGEQRGAVRVGRPAGGLEIYAAVARARARNFPGFPAAGFSGPFQPSLFSRSPERKVRLRPT